MSSKVCGIEASSSCNRFNGVPKSAHMDGCVRAWVSKERITGGGGVNDLQGDDFSYCIDELASGVKLDCRFVKGGDVFERCALRFTNYNPFCAFGQGNNVFSLGQKLKLYWLAILLTRLATSQQTSEA